MENRHLNFEEIVKFVYASEITSQTLSLAQRVNSHIICCEECRQAYNVILEIHDRLQESEKNFLNRIVYDDKWIELVALSIRNDREIIMNNIKSVIGKVAYRFNYPISIGNRSRMEIEENNRNVLVDEENSYNRIEYKNEKLIVQLDREGIEKKEAALCILDESNHIVFLEQMEQEEELFKKEISLEKDKIYKILVV